MKSYLNLTRQPRLSLQSQSRNKPLSLAFIRAVKILCLIWLIPLCGLCQQWQTTTMPLSPRDDGAAFSVNGFGYYGLGGDNSAVYQSDFAQYSLATNTWSGAPSLPGAGRQYTAVMEFDSLAVVCGGQLAGGYSNEVFAFDGSKWTQKRDAPFAPRSNCAAFVVDGLGYLAGGRDGEHYLNDFWQYNPQTDRWQQLDTLPFSPRDEMSAFALNGRGHLLLGRDSNGLIAEHWRWDAFEKEWEQLADFGGGPLSHGSAVVVGSLVLLAGGNNGIAGQGDAASLETSVWQYNDVTGWSVLTQLPDKPMRGMDAFAIGNSAVFCGGFAPQYTKKNIAQHLSIPSEAARNYITVSPNPAFHLAVLGAFVSNAEARISLHNTAGELVYGPFHFFERYADVIPLATWPSGVYYIELTSNGDRTTQALVVSQ